MKEKLKDRYLILAICIVLAMSLIILRLAELQIIKGEYYKEVSQRKLLNEWKVTAPRGNIIDASGVPIAVSEQGFKLQIVKSPMETDDLNAMLLDLINLMEKNGDTYFKTFSKLITFNPLGYGSYVSDYDDKLGRLKRILKNEILGINEKKLDSFSSLEEVYDYLKNDVFRINSRYTEEEAYKIMTLRYEIRGYNAFNPITIAKNVSRETVAVVEEMHNRFPGVTTDIEPVRKYIDAPAVAHVLGYIGNIGSEYEKLKDEGYGINDIIGKTGVELAAEKDLRGKDGKRYIEVDIWGRQTSELKVEPAIPGNTVQLTINMKLQKVAAESLARTIDDIRNKRNGTNVNLNFGDAYGGAVVALDVNSGEVLAMASYPGYDPNWFLRILEDPGDKEAQQAVSDLFSKDPLAAPMVNKAIQGAFAPGSTYKPLVGIAALEEGIISPQTTVNDTGRIDVDGIELTCMDYRHGLGAHGYINLERALSTSCNIFFHVVGMQTSIDNIVKWARMFGLGEKTGIDVDSSIENPGVLASRETKKEVYKEYPVWVPIDTAYASIGQSFNAFTPLQLANYTATIANGGKRYTPYIIKRVIKYDGSIVRETKPQYTQIPVKEENIKAVQKGMIAVANSEDGTAVDLFKDFPFEVAAKTGTAETGQKNHSNNGVFICYAPADPGSKPEIAIAVVIERGVYGRFGARVARDIMMEYFNLNNPPSQDNEAKGIEPELIR